MASPTVRRPTIDGGPGTADGEQLGVATVLVRPGSEPRPTRPWPSRRVRLWAFPAIVGLLLVTLVVLGWNGSSSGATHQLIEGEGADPRGVFGEPNALRSDEWAVSTPLVVSQDSYDYVRVNDDYFGGTDASVFSSLPYREWSVLFRPQFVGFLFLPFDQAFALYWWLPAVILALGCYGLVLAISPDRPGMAAAAGVAMLASPFVQWWFLIITLASLGWAAVVVAAFVMLERAPSRRARLAWGGLMAYAVAGLLLVIYPGFQIACGWVVVACLVGWTFRSGAGPSLGQRLRRLGLGAAAGAVGAAVFAVFALTRWETIERVANTEYPGNRRIPSGSGHMSWLMSGFLDSRLPKFETWAELRRDLPPQLGLNSSEASSFVYLGFFLVVPAVWLLARGWRRERQVDGLLLALIALLTAYLGYVLVPGLDLVASLTLLSRVQPPRLFIGLGLLSLVLVAAVIREMDRQRVRGPWWVVALTGGIAALVLARTGHQVEQVAPRVSGGVWHWLSLAVLVVAMVVVAARGFGTLAMAGLALFSVIATFRVNPVHDGVYDARDTPVGEAVVAVDRSGGSGPGGWIALGMPAELALAAQPVDRRSGVALYPNFDNWTPLDPTGEHRAVYNRYANVVFSEDPTVPELSAPGTDLIIVRFEPCGHFAQQRLGHVLADHPVEDSCLRLNREVSMPGTTFYIYDVVEPSSTP
jgi:hypothetical protein